MPYNKFNACDTCSQPKAKCHCEEKVQYVKTDYIPTKRKDNCDPCGKDFELVATPVEHCEAQTVYPAQSCQAPSHACIEPEFGVSSPNGLYASYQFGLGVENKVKLPGSGQNSGHNLIPWYGIDWSFLDPSFPFSPRIVENCDGTIREEKDRTTLLVKNPFGDIIKEYKAPSVAGGSGSYSVRITDSNPLTNQVITPASGEPLVIEAGDGIDLIAINGGYRIKNSSIATPVKLISAPGSGIVITGGQNQADTDGIVKQTFTVGIDCGTLRGNCGLVKSVNGVVPDMVGNVTLTTGSGVGGLNTISSPTGSISVNYPSTGSATVDVNYNITDQRYIRVPTGGLADQVLVRNADGTTRWADLCQLITQLGCFTGGGSTTIAAPSNAKAGQSVNNGGASNGSTPYSCGDPLLSWNVSVTPGVTYEVRDGSTVLATNISGTTYQTI